jgi:hypothetical protein
MMRFFYFCILSSLFVSLFACQSSTASKSAKSGPKNGHQRMVAILDSIFRNENPEKCYNLNSRSAGQFKAMLSKARTQQEQIIGNFKVAEQLLYAGQTEESIDVLKRIIGDNFAAMSEENKLLFDLYALAYLRLGEQQNCIQNHTSESCIIPIAEAGQHKLVDGSTRAIEIYTKILEKFPKDSQSKWLLNIANMTLGKYPSGVPAAFRIPESVFKPVNGPKFKDIAIDLGVSHRNVSGGVCMEDFDNDGDLDIFMTSYLLNSQCQFYKNNGDGTFTNRTKEANLTGIVSGLNTVHADYDNDGDRDILILRGGWLDAGLHPNSLLRNNGDGTFLDVTIESGMLSFHPTQTATWADFNGDGFLDLFIANESSKVKGLHPCELYLNNKNGTFTNVAAQVGLDRTGFFKAVAAGDINNDQLPDLYLSDFSAENQLWVNQTKDPDHMVFQNMTEKAGVGKPVNSFPAFMFDYNNDGWLDLFVGGYDPKLLDNAAGVVLDEYLGKKTPGDFVRMYQNKGDGTFADVTQKMGVNKIMFGMGNNFGDIDNDGWLDFYIGTGTADLRSLVPNRMFHNKNGTVFEEITMNGFGNIQKGHGIAFGDVDQDGDQDIYMVMGGAYEGDLANNVLFQNPGNDNKWINLVLEGKTANRDAIGARIILTVKTLDGKTRKIYNSVGNGGSFGSSSLRAEIGLGNASSIESLEIKWPKPAAASQVFNNIPLNAVLKITEGNAEATTIDWKPIPMGGGGHGGMHHDHHQ